MPRSPGHQNTARGLLVEVTRKEDYYRGFQRKGSSQHALLEGLALAVLLALALPRHPPHEPPRAAPGLLLRRRLPISRGLRDGWAAAARQLDRFFFLKRLSRVFHFFGRAGPVLEQLLGDLFGLLLVADDLRAVRCVTASARWRCAWRSRDAKAVVSSATGRTSAAAARPTNSNKRRIFGLPDARWRLE